MSYDNGCGLCSVNIENIGVKRGRQVLLDDVSFTMHCGELTALIGVNGAGKTTLLRSVLGEIRHTGSVRFCSHDGKTLDNITIGYVPQHLEFDRSAPVSVMDFLMAGRTRRPVFLPYSRKEVKEVRRALKDAGCEDLEKRSIGELSGGEMQRVMMAQALYPVPELLILDEPVSGVDSVGSEQFYESVQKLLKEYHMSIILVSHDLDLVRLHADKAVLLQQKVLKAGTVEEVFQSSEFRSTFSGGAV